jgi:AcrR family transcriptional regulator
MPKITQAQRETRRQQILDAALRCFSRDGFHNTTTADIVRESGVSQGTLYLYFATKDDIIVALADNRHQGEAMLTALAKSEDDPVEGLAMLLQYYGRALDDAQRNDQRRVGIQGWAEALRNPTIHASVTGGLTAVRIAVEELVRRGQASGRMRTDLEPEAIARLMIAIFHGMTLQVSWAEDFVAKPVDDAMVEMVRGVLFGAVRAADFQPTE